MEYSSGVILFKKCDDGNLRFFVCTPDGPYWFNRELWSFPKGHIEINETPFEAAIREFKEETSVQLSKNINLYVDNGIVRQNKNKIVYVFSKELSDEVLENCISNECVSEYPRKSGIFITHKEIKDYNWLTLDELIDVGMKCYIPIYESIVEYNQK